MINTCFLINSSHYISNSVFTTCTSSIFVNLHFNNIFLRDGVWLWTGFGFMIGFIGLLDTARDYILQFTITHTYTHTHTTYTY
jgi:hypothetical protein